MIDFEEELKKFHPSLEVKDVEDTIRRSDVSDMLDLLLTMINSRVRSPQEMT